MIQQVPSPFEIALDIGHSSIGWAIFQNGEKFDLLGTGVVLFPADDCLAIKRRNYRRQRRHVRATRQRIERLKKLLLHVGVLTEAELNLPGCAWPWKLAAEVLSGHGRLLTWPELWDVLRWYAHNRGYDGNARWSKQEEKVQEKKEKIVKEEVISDEDAALAEDKKKLAKAWDLMEKHSKQTMAETFCAELGVEALGTIKASQVYFKGCKAAFPRHIVYTEVQCILEKHVGSLAQLTPEVVRTLIGSDDDAWQTVTVPSVRLPKRYKGSYLFGQSIPRFDNRIISSCPITYARILADGGDKKKAVRDSKVPVKKCREFLLYRWAMNLAKLKVTTDAASRPLTKDERKAIHQVMVKGDPQIKSEPGHLTKPQLKKAVNLKTGTLQNNVDECFSTPRAEDDLWLRPRKLPSGRAPYTRQVMKEAVKDVFEGKHPMEEGNSLHLSEEIRKAQLERTLEEKTNNHLVRHRVLITRRLVNDIIKSYAGEDASRIAKITIEVNRDLQAFSGKTNKEIEGELNQMLKDHSNVVKRLEKDIEESGEKHLITAGLIRKARIATDMGWKCPYTGKDYDTLELIKGHYDKDHIIPRSLRPSDSLESLVITSKAVNAMKGNRTALQFIKEFGNKDIEGAPNVGNQKPNLFNEKQYRQFISKLDIRSGHKQDRDRKKKRQDLLELERYEEKGFLPKDLTQTSHLVRLAATELEKDFTKLEKKPRIVSLPGSVTGEIRKGWKLYGCLAAHNPEVQKLLDRKEAEPELNIKKELRNITHQHHALDACVIGYASHYIPNEGNLWSILLKRNRCPDEEKMLIEKGFFIRDGQGRAHLRELSEATKHQITERLKECRVVQHVPKRMDGLAAEETVWRLVDFNDTHPSSKQLQRWLRETGLEPLSDDSDVAYIVRSIRKEKNAIKPTKLIHETVQFWIAYDKIAKTKLVGIHPSLTNKSPKLKQLKAVKVISDNFGLALWKKESTPDGEMEAKVIVWHKVWPKLKAIAEKENNAVWPEVLRNGQLIQIAKGRYQGIWRVTSTKHNANGLNLAIARTVDIENYKENVLLRSLIKEGLKIPKPTLIGIPTCPTTSSV